MEEAKIKSLFQSFWLFVAKATALLVLVQIFLSLLLSEVKDDERARLFLLSLVQNPVALYKVSEYEERYGKIDSAIRDIELAIGLLEMHAADKTVIKRYHDRLEALRAKKNGS